MFDTPIVVGSLVVYTTNSRDSGLTHGRVEDIYEVDSYSYKIIKVKIRPVHRDGSTEYQQEYALRVPGDYNTRYSFDSHKPMRASTIDYAAHKILVLE
jgi:hypothetical protein